LLDSFDVVEAAIRASDDTVLPLIDDMRDHVMVQPTSGGGNHVLWVLGHLACAEAHLYRMLTGEPHPLEHWRAIFDAGSTPVPDPSSYPPFSEVREAYRYWREKNLTILESAGNEGLSQRPAGPLPDVGREYFATVGHAFVANAIHQAFHGGQVADARRAAGRPPLME
jgi:hypothetical protein